MRNLPCLWFGASKGLPTPAVVKAAFRGCGPIAQLAILPSATDDELDKDDLAFLALNFDVYIQFEDLASVLKLLAACQGRELRRLYKGRSFTVCEIYST